MKDLVIIVQLTKNDTISSITPLINAILKKNINLVVIDNFTNVMNNSFEHNHLEIFRQEKGINNIEVIKEIYNEKIEKGYKYFLHWPSDYQFIDDLLEIIYHQIKRGYDIVIPYDNSLKIKFGFVYKFFYRLLTFSSIKQPFSKIYCFNWFVVQNYIKNERLNIEPSAFIFFHERLHLKLLSLSTNYNVPTLVKKHGTMYSLKQAFRLFYYLLIPK